MTITTTTSTDGIEYRGLISEAPNSDTIIIHIHGMSGSAIQETYYNFMHEQYPKAGISFLAVEHRGTGSITQFNSDHGGLNIGNTFEIFEDCVHDIQGWVNFAKARGYNKIWLQAHSLGPSKVAYYMTKINAKEQGIEGLLWISPSDMIGLMFDPIGFKDHEKLLPEAVELMKQGKPRQILSAPLWDGVILSAQSYIAFFGEGAKDAIFNYGKPELGWDVVNSINVPVLAMTGTKDDGIVPVMDAYKAMEILERELKNSPRKKTVVYEGAEHSFEGFEQQIVDDVLAFILQK